MAKRRANGEGNIRKRKDGRWEGRWEGRYIAGYDDSGKRIIKNVLGKTQAEVKAKLKDAVALADVSNVAKADEYTLVQWLRYWMDTYGKVYLRESSQINYEGFLKNQISKNAVGKIKLQKLTTHDLQVFYNHMGKCGRVQRKESEKQPKGLAPKSIRNMHFFISHALEQAVKEKMIPENPATGCILPRKEKTEMKTLPLDKLEAFFLEARHSGVLELYYTELSTGLRRGELLGIHWDDIDFETGSIYIQRQITRLNGVVKESPLKTKNAYRQIIVVPEVIQMLREKKEREDGFSAYVFSSPVGGPMCPDSMLKMLHRVLHRAGLEEIPFHSLRHPYVKTATTFFLQNFKVFFLYRVAYCQYLTCATLATESAQLFENIVSQSILGGSSSGSMRPSTPFL